MSVAIALMAAACGGSPGPAASAATLGTPPATVEAKPNASLAATAAATTSAAPGSRGPWIAFTARAASGDFGVLLVRPDGTDSHWPTSGVPGQFQEHPDWSPDGRRLAFSVTDLDGTKDLWVADLDGSNAQRIVDCQAPCAWADDAAWSPDGTAIAFQRTVARGAARTSTIERWDVSAKTARVLVTATDGMTFYAPRWSPDGRALVAEDATNGKTLDDPPVANVLVVIDLAGNVPTLRPLTDPTRLANNPDWSSRGNVIVFCLPAPSAGFDGPVDLYSMAPSGGPMTRLTSLAEAGGRAIQPTITPDGSSVLFVLGGPTGTDRGLAEVPIGGGTPRSATSSGYIGGVHPRLQPTP